MTRRDREQLRQERMAFEQARRHNARWFALRLAMGYAGLGALVLAAATAAYVLFHPSHYPQATATLAATALLLSVLPLALAVVRLVLRQTHAAPLAPLTGARPRLPASRGQ